MVCYYQGCQKFLKPQSYQSSQSESRYEENRKKAPCVTEKLNPLKATTYQWTKKLIKWNTHIGDRNHRCCYLANFCPNLSPAVISVTIQVFLSHCYYRENIVSVFYLSIYEFYLPGRVFPQSMDDDTDWTSSYMNHRTENVFLLLTAVQQKMGFTRTGSKHAWAPTLNVWILSSNTVLGARH